MNVEAERTGSPYRYEAAGRPVRSASWGNIPYMTCSEEPRRVVVSSSRNVSARPVGAGYVPPDRAVYTAMLVGEQAQRDAQAVANAETQRLLRELDAKWEAIQESSKASLRQVASTSTPAVATQSAPDLIGSTVSEEDRKQAKELWNRDCKDKQVATLDRLSVAVSALVRGQSPWLTDPVSQCEALKRMSEGKSP